jgi:hypothetical protein
VNRLYEAIAEAAGIEGREVLAFVEDGYGREVALLAAAVSSMQKCTSGSRTPAT